jgi:hypothetical protein
MNGHSGVFLLAAPGGYRPAQCCYAGIKNKLPDHKEYKFSSQPGYIVTHQAWPTPRPADISLCGVCHGVMKTDRRISIKHYSRGARPSPGAATFARTSAEKLFNASLRFHLAAPEDGRAPPQIF